MPYDVSEIRKKLRKQKRNFVDPDEFRPPKVEAGKTVNFRFFILPPIQEGTQLKSGVTEKGMNQFFIQHANHWLNRRPYPCPRIWNEEDCPTCQEGFKMLEDDAVKNNKDLRRKIVDQFMPSSYYMVNIYFTHWEGNPEDLRGRVKFYNASKTCFDIWSDCLMRDDAGDKEDPKAHGVFFDENAGYVFQLACTRQGLNNSYKTSKFLPNGGKPQPMAKSEEAIEKLLLLRHNLFSKIEEPNMEKLQSAFNAMVHGDDDDSSGGFDQDETQTESKAPAKTKKSKPAKEEPVDDGPVDDGPVDDGPVDDGPVDDGPVDDGPVDEAPAEEKPKKEAPAEDEDDADIDALLNQLDED